MFGDGTNNHWGHWYWVEYESSTVLGTLRDMGGGRGLLPFAGSFSIRKDETILAKHQWKTQDLS